MADPSASSSPDKNGTVSELQQIYQIISDRSEGRASNEDVEAAVSRLLSKETTAPQQQHSETKRDDAVAATTISSTVVLKKPPPPTAAKAAVQGGPVIDEDLEDYDDDDETPSSRSPSSLPPTTTAGQQQVVGRKRKRNNNTDNDSNAPVEPDWSMYSEIPLGKEGAKMMTTFGDCRQGPDPGAVEATLLGARRMVQAVLQDARHIRRKYRKVYRHAKETLRQDQPQKPVQQQEWTAELLYKALQGYDPQATAPPCGFGLQELRQLCPEEMNAYARWNAMHDAAIVDEKQESEKVAAAAAVAAARKTDKGNGENDDVDDEDAVVDDDDDADDEDAAPIDMVLAEGHLQERAEQFDLRTDRMEKGWYLKFANIRRGSFLPRRTRNDPDQAAWQDFQDRDKKKSKKHHFNSGGGVWANKPLNDIRFLHWVGFDPQSALPPPNKETTHALAFIAHDFMGRIVEKAILLRNQQKQRENGNTDTGSDDNSTLVLNELQAGERLEKADIERAMQDPDIKPQPIYSASSNNDAKKVGTQLYFGPGFEKRLELEMEEIIQTWAKKKDDLPEEEIQIRQEEEELFQKLSAPPSLGVAGLLVDSTALDEDDNNDMDDEDVKPAAKKKRAGKTNNDNSEHSTVASEEPLDSSASQQEVPSSSQPTPPKRKMGRPRGSKNKPKTTSPPQAWPPMGQQHDETGSLESAPPSKRKAVGRPKSSKGKQPKAPPS